MELRTGRILQPPATESPHRSGYLIAVVSTMGAAAATVTGKWNLEAISPLLMNALIFSIATIMLSFWVIPRYGLAKIFRLDRRGWFWVGMFTLTSWVAVLAFWAGVQHMDPTLAAFLNRSEVLIAVGLGILLLKERFTKLETLGLLLSIIGIVIMRLTLRGEYSVGFWLVLLGSLFFGITEFVSKIGVRYVNPMILTFIRNAFLALGYWAVFFTTDLHYQGLDRVWLGVIALGFFGPILSRLLYLMALRHLTLSKVAVISQSQPVFVIIIALAFLHQLPTAREAIGGLFLLVGCTIMIAGHRRPTATAQAQVIPSARDQV